MARARIGLQGPSPKADLIGPLKPDLGARDLLIQLRLQRALQHHREVAGAARVELEACHVSIPGIMIGHTTVICAIRAHWARTAIRAHWAQ